MRISRNHMFLEMARTVSKRSTCHRLNVGAILVLDNRPVSMGYNGPESGEPHCKGTSCEVKPTGGCLRSIHAEANAIKYFMEHRSEKTEGPLTLYCTHSPCRDCAEKIVEAGIQTVFYETAYRDDSPLKFLMEMGVKVLRFSPSGYLYNHNTGVVQDA